VNDFVRQAAPSLKPLDDRGRAVLFTDARTASTFAPIPVSDAELAGIWELAKWGPTAANTQPLRVLYVRQRDACERLAQHVYDMNKAKVASAPAVAVLAWDTQFHDHIPTVLPFRPQLKDVYDADREHRVHDGTFNSALQAGYFILSVRAHGLAAGPMAGFDAGAVDAEFFPDGRWRTVLLVNIGHPGENAWMGRLPRLQQSEVVRWA
jgi:3-hydroxypropanoate dehydrogenase